MRVIIREAAYDDLDRIYAWIAKDRPRSADSAIDRILESAERLGRFPYMGHVGGAPGTYEWVVSGLPYIVVYKVNSGDDVVEVVAVFHGAQKREKQGE
jgi:toxin ParE1/3/4